MAIMENETEALSLDHMINEGPQWMKDDRILIGAYSGNAERLCGATG